jgi:hypothetical protein
MSPASTMPEATPSFQFLTQAGLNYLSRKWKHCRRLASKLVD